MLVAIRKFFGKFLGKYRIFRYPYKFLKFIVTEGFSNAFLRVRKKLRGNKNIKYTQMYQRIFVSQEELEKQKQIVFTTKPLISILVPLYNTPKDFLIDMVNSVIQQTYENWELILVDASDNPKENEGFIDSLCDSRINYSIIEENTGIVGNTNIAYLKATGNFIGLLDHDDMLASQCLFEIVKEINKGNDLIYTDEITFKKNPRKDCYQPNLKPDYSPDTLRSYNYICHFTCFSRNLMEENEKLLDYDTEGSQDYDLILRLTERAKGISHIAIPLYFWRAHSASVAENVGAKPYVIDAAMKALQKHLERVGLEGTVTEGRIPTTYKINYKIMGNPLISIIIPNCDHIEDLKKCIQSILDKTTYKRFEIIVVENNSKEKNTFDYYEKIKSDNIKIIYYQGAFNFSKINNFAIPFATGNYVLFLNNDVEVISNDWLQEMLMYAQRSDVGCVGAKLIYPDNTIQHAGVIIGIGGVAGHSHKYYHKDDFGFMSRLQIVQNLSAVTAACLMIKKDLFLQVNGFDEGFSVAFNDVDFCLKVQQLKKLCIYTPYAELYHYESKSRGQEDSPEKIARFNEEITLFDKKWGLWRNDPYYNQNLSLTNEQFDIS